MFKKKILHILIITCLAAQPIQANSYIDSIKDFIYEKLYMVPVLAATYVTYRSIMNKLESRFADSKRLPFWEAVQTGNWKDSGVRQGTVNSGFPQMSFINGLLDPKNQPNGRWEQFIWNRLLAKGEASLLSQSVLGKCQLGQSDELKSFLSSNKTFSLKSFEDATPIISKKKSDIESPITRLEYADPSLNRIDILTYYALNKLKSSSKDKKQQKEKLLKKIDLWTAKSTYLKDDLSQVRDIIGRYEVPVKAAPQQDQPIDAEIQQ